MFFPVLVVSALARSPSSGLVLSQGAMSDKQLIKTGVKAPAFDKVLTMLSNLVAQIESEEKADTADYTAYMQWFERQHTTTSSAITALSTKISTVLATLGELQSQQAGLATQVQEQTAELDQEQGQLDDAKDKRASEHDGFVKEQLEFDNAIAGCNRAVEILQAHYGDGSPKKSTRPAWMDLQQILHSVKRSAHKIGRPVPAALTNLLQQTPGMVGTTMFNNYDSGTNAGEALNIVDQVKLLAQTFQEDKDSSIEQENQLQGAFETLMGQKSALIASLTKERDAQQSVLNGLNQQISEQENAKATAQSTLQSEQAYLTQMETQEKDTAATYESRKADQAAEKKAVGDAISVLSAANPQLIQIHKSFKRRLAFLQAGADPRLQKAAMLLKQKASKFHSQLLATAAAEAGTSDVLATVVQELHGLTARLDQEQASELSHKEWCEKELADTAAKKKRHEDLVAELQKTISEVEGTISEKQDAAEENVDAIDEADRKFSELTSIRSKAKADFDAELEDYNDAIDALNQAVDMLADFYRDGGSAFVQTKLKLKSVQAPSASDAPSVAGGPRSNSGGMGVVTSLKETREEFDAGKAALVASEQKAVADYGSAKTAHEASRQALVEAGNRLTVELQTAQNEMVMAKESLESNEREVSATTDYLANVGKSCNSLLEHFEDRSELRAQEKAAIQDAIQVLSSS